VPDPLAAAIAENALWCDHVGRAIGARTAVDVHRWWSDARMPPFHPDAVSLVPGVAARDLLAGVDVGPGCSVKDSHADVDLAPAGFSVALTGRWWHRPPGPVPASALMPAVVALGDEVVGGVLAGDPAMRLVAARDDQGRVRARAVLHDADPGAGAVVGVSNLTADPGFEAQAWRAIVGVASGRHLVGWEREEDLASVVAVGGRTLGPLRVWLRPDD